MKSSETYINSQAPPKVAFVATRSDFSFLLHMHIFQRLLHCHMFPKTGARKQPVPPQGKLPALSYAISSGVPSRTRPQHCCAQPTTPWGLSETWSNLQQRSSWRALWRTPSVIPEGVTSELLLVLMSQNQQESQSPSAVSFPLFRAKVENPFDSLLSLLWPFSLL